MEREGRERETSTWTSEMKTKLIILGAVGLALVGGVAYGIKKIAEMVHYDK